MIQLLNIDNQFKGLDMGQSAVASFYVDNFSELIGFTTYGDVTLLAGSKAFDKNNKVVMLDENGEWNPIEHGSGGGLPEVTSDDNGDVLTVVDGVWAKAEAPAPEPELPEVTSADNGKSLQVESGAWTAKAPFLNRTINDNVFLETDITSTEQPIYQVNFGYSVGVFMLTLGDDTNGYITGMLVGDSSFSAAGVAFSKFAAVGAYSDVTISVTRVTGAGMPQFQISASTTGADVSLTSAYLRLYQLK